ncbi:MAG TPA: hypothetical protein VNO24_21465 [Blastocatellia bacterium]|nr:hypothetical protein [Blastocatellia bacterium]
MSDLHRKPKIGVMGSARAEMSEPEVERLTALATRLGQVIAERGCVLVTGATTGFPDIASRAARRHGCLTVGISPASSREEHISRYSLPDDGADLIIYTGFGLKGRNVINVRSSDVVIILGGGIGTLNEFTIAYDEGKVVGVLEGTGGAADQIKNIEAISSRRAESALLFESSPEALIDGCLRMLGELNGRAGRKGSL